MGVFDDEHHLTLNLLGISSLNCCKRHGPKRRRHDHDCRPAALIEQRNPGFTQAVTSEDAVFQAVRAIRQWQEHLHMDGMNTELSPTMSVNVIPAIAGGKDLEEMRT